MLPEQAWDLKKGEKVIAIQPDTGVIWEGVVIGLVNRGFSVQEYVEGGASIIHGIERQHDAPAILINHADDSKSIWRPDYVQLVTETWVLECGNCLSFTYIPLSLRYYKLIKDGDFLTPSFPEKEMIQQKRCKHCVKH